MCCLRKNILDSVIFCYCHCGPVTYRVVFKYNGNKKVVTIKEYTLLNLLQTLLTNAGFFIMLPELLV